MAQPKTQRLHSSSQTRYPLSARNETKTTIPAMPLVIVYESRRIALHIDERDDDTLFRMTDRAAPGQEPNVRQDVYKLREAFLGVGTQSEAVDFLIAAGGFRTRLSDEPEDSLRLSDFGHWQAAIRAMMSNGPLPNDIWEYDTRSFLWVDHHTEDQYIRAFVGQLAKGERISCVHPLSLTIGPDTPSQGDTSRRKLRAEVTVHSALEGMLAATFLDALNGIQTRLCALPDCQNIFEVQSRHDRQYCTQACAHKASVRRRRAEAKAAKSPAAMKQEKSRLRKGKV